MSFGLDLKVWLLVGGLSLGAIGELLHLTVCHWIPSTRGAAICGVVADTATMLGHDATGISNAIPDGGMPPLALPGLVLP
jgi:hypothetical protein